MRKKNLWLLTILSVLLSFSSCKKDTVDMTHLLSTVPSSAAGVMVLNIESMLEDAGCKIKDHVVIPGKELSGLLDNISVQNKEEILMLMNGESGIEPKGAVVFYDANRVFLTFALYDVNKFCNYIESRDNSKFQETGSGVKVNGKVAVKGSQAWVILDTRKEIDPDAISAYSSLSTSQSFLVTQYGERLLVEEDDIRGWAVINTFANEMLGGSDRSMLTLTLGFLFEDAESVSFKVDFDKGEMEAEAKVLNEKGKPAKYLLPSEKIDVNTLKGLGSTCDAMMAFTLNSKLIKKFEQLGAAFGGSLFGDLGDTFKNVDGTVGIIAGTNSMESLNGVITTKGEVSKTLRDLISNQLAPVSQEGKLLYFSKGDVSGHLQVEECAEELKGSCLGFVSDTSGLNNVGYDSKTPGFKSVALKLKPDSGGLEIELKVKTTDPKENSLLTMLKK